ncbi:hypothetical protein JKP88DRAFT_260953 [Tribonema minus]|uniref:Uncharacterized protein n=1 Tax=Tribonema minus TaxID=303371 RepID=A0A835Z5S4_9STRA|nr:hypothetical protein JKP88DRAFT_260953 [Tribonema minus]
MDSRIRGNACSLQYDSTGDPGEAQGLVLQAVRSIDTTLTAVARGSGVVFVKLKDQLSFVKHARRVQEALSTDTVTISTPTIHSKFDSRSAIFTNTPAVSAPAAPSACVAPPSLTSTPSLARAIEEDTLLDYVERHQRVQWEGYVVKITISLTLFGRVVLGDMQGADFFNDTTGEVLYAGDTVPDTAKLREDGCVRPEFNNEVGLCQRLRSIIAVALPTVVAAAAIVMEERQRPQAPHIVLFVKTHNSPTFDTLTSFLHDLDKVLSTVRVPCFSMRTTPSHFVHKNTIHNFGPRDYAVVSSGGLRTLWPLATDFFMPAGTFSQGISILNDKLVNMLSQRAVARLAGAYQSANADAIAECLVNIAPGAPIQAWRALQQLQQADGVAAVSTRLEAIMHGLALQDTQRLQQRVEQQQLHHRSLEATCLQYREQCERQHTELQGSVAEVRRAIAAERSSLSQLQREKEAVVARHVVERFAPGHSAAPAAVQACCLQRRSTYT